MGDSEPSDKAGMIVQVQVRGNVKTYRNAERAYVSKGAGIVVIDSGEKYTHQYGEIVGCHVGCRLQEHGTDD